MFHSLLVPLDGSEFSERSLPFAQAIARTASASLHLVQVAAPAVPAHFISSSAFEYQGLDLEGYAQRHRTEAQQYLESVAKRLDDHGISVSAELVEGNIADKLAWYAGHVDADLIVMTTHGRTGVSKVWLGSVADALVRHTSVPVFLMHPEDPYGVPEEVGSIDNILVPLDGSPLAEAVLKPATAMAEATGARLTLTHMVSSHAVLGAQLFPLLPDDIVIVREKAEEYLTGVAEGLRAKGLTVETHLEEHEAPATAIAEVAKKVDAKLIALATHGYGGLKKALLGSVADKVLRASALPLLVVRPEEES